MKSQVYRLLWEHCQNPDVLHVGPVLYFTERNGNPKKLRPYRREEALEIAARYNAMSKKVFHEVEELR